MFTLSLLAALLAAEAQPSAKVATIGYLSMIGGAPGGAPLAETFRQTLQDLGYVEGKTIAIVYRSAEGQPERLPALAAELVQLPVDVILAQSGQVAQVAKDITTTWTCSHDTGHIWEEILPHPSESMSLILQALERQ
jgi:putative ABC transport system substrate-binding protein